MIYNKTNKIKAMLHEAIFLATCNATMTNKKPLKLQWGVTRKQLVSQLATQQTLHCKLQENIHV